MTLVLDGCDTDRETLRLLQAWVAWQNPKVVVEAGTYRGHGMLHLAQGLSAVRPEGRVYTADLYEWGQTALAEEYGLENTAIWLGDFDAMLDTIEGPIDFGWIDSGPGSGQYAEESGVRWRHWCAAKARVSPGGVLIAHDTAFTDWGGALEIVADGNLTLPFGRGLTFYQRPL